MSGAITTTSTTIILLLLCDELLCLVDLNGRDIFVLNALCSMLEALFDTLEVVVEVV